jgi:hypothetical protein
MRHVRLIYCQFGRQFCHGTTINMESKNLAARFDIWMIHFNINQYPSSWLWIVASLKSHRIFSCLTRNTTSASLILWFAITKNGKVSRLSSMWQWSRYVTMLLSLSDEEILNAKDWVSLNNHNKDQNRDRITQQRMWIQSHARCDTSRSDLGIGFITVHEPNAREYRESPIFSVLDLGLFAILTKPQKYQTTDDSAVADFDHVSRFFRVHEIQWRPARSVPHETRHVSNTTEGLTQRTNCGWGPWTLTIRFRLKLPENMRSSAAKPWCFQASIDSQRNNQDCFMAEP